MTTTIMSPGTGTVMGAVMYLSLTSIYSVDRTHSISIHTQPHAFLSNSDGSYTHTWVGGQPIKMLTPDWSGDYFANGPIIVGNGNVVIEEVSHAVDFSNLAGRPIGPRFNWHDSTLADVDNDGKLRSDRFYVVARPFTTTCNQARGDFIREMAAWWT